MTDTIMAIEQFEAAIGWQAQHAEENDAPCTARIIRTLPKVRETDTQLGQRLRDWEGLTLKDALPLRVTGGLHYLALTAADVRLLPVYRGEVIDQDAVDALVMAMVADHDAALVGWLDGPPQTNEAGRSASIMAGFLWVAQRASARFELFELGASAGVNTMLDRFHFQLGSTSVGSPQSPMQIKPVWRGKASPPAPPANFEITRIRGCDVEPIDLSDPDSALRLKGYVWPDAPVRMERIDAAITLASARPPDLVKMDAGEFVSECLDKPQQAGTTRAMFHSIMWQYMPADTQDAITAAMEAAGARASVDRPLAWVSLETDPATFLHELKVRIWDGGAHDGAAQLLAHAHPHGAWVEWGGG